MNYDLGKLFEHALPFLLREGIVSNREEAKQKREYLLSVFKLVRARVKTLVELADACSYFFQNEHDACGVGLVVIFLRM